MTLEEGCTVPAGLADQRLDLPAGPIARMPLRPASCNAACGRAACLFGGPRRLAQHAGHDLMQIG